MELGHVVHGLIILAFFCRQPHKMGNGNASQEHQVYPAHTHQVCEGWVVVDRNNPRKKNADMNENENKNKNSHSGDSNLHCQKADVCHVCLFYV